MESTDDKILKRLSKCGRGNIFFPNDFVVLAEIKTILKSLERLTHIGKLIRIARGIYYYPKYDKTLGLGVLYPSYEQIAQSIAKRDKIRIAPAGAYAMNILGLTTQVPMNIVFMTDGTARKIQLFDGHQLCFKHTTPKNLSFQNKTAQLIVFALKEIGAPHITQEHTDVLRKILLNIPESKISVDYKLMPSWIRTFIKQVYELL